MKVPRSGVVRFAYEILCLFCGGFLRSFLLYHRYNLNLFLEAYVEYVERLDTSVTLEAKISRYQVQDNVFSRTHCFVPSVFHLG